MPFKLPNAVQETTTTSGTGALALLGAVAGRKAFSSQLANADTTAYVIEDGTDWECGIGTFTGPGTLSRDTVIYSTNGNALVNWPASGTRNVYVSAIGEMFASLVAPAAGTGLLAQTADRTYARRAITVGFGLGIANGDGVAGNPVVSQTLLPAGTRMLFYQAAAPTGWTQITTHNDKALRVVSGVGAGSGGATAFTGVFGASKATASGDAPLPAHTHTFSATTSSDGSHTHSFVGIATTGTDTRINAGTVSGALAATNTNGAHTHGVSGTTATTGSGTGSHVHGLSLDLQYIDVIICELNA